MGQEIVYCLICQSQLRGSDFEKNNAYKIGVESVCKKCVPEATRTLPPEKIKALLKSMTAAAHAKEAPAETPKSGTGRIPVSTPKKGTERIMPSTPRKGTGRIPHATPPPMPAVPEGNKAAPLIIVVSIVAVVILIAVSFSGKAPPPEAAARIVAPAPPIEIPAPAPAPVEGAREAAARESLKKALAYAASKPADLAGQGKLFDQALLDARGSAVEPETRRSVETARRRIQEAVSQELLALDDRLKTACLKEEFKPALALVEESRKRALSSEWSGEMDRRTQDVLARAETLFARLKEQALKAAPVELPALKARVAKWGLDRFDLGRALAEDAPKPPPVAPAPPPPPPPSAPEPPKINPAAELEAFQPKWTAAMIHAFARDFPAAIQELEKAAAELKDPSNKAQAAADLDLLKGVAAFHADALQTLGKLTPGKKIALACHDYDYNPVRVEGPFLRVRDGIVEISKGKPFSGVPIGNIAMRSFADFGGSRNRTTAALACLIDGDAPGAKELLADAGSVAPRWWAWGEQAAARFVDPAQRKLDRDAGYAHYYAAQVMNWPPARAEAAMSCRKLLDEQGASTTWVRRNRAMISPLTELAKDYVQGPAQLRAAGSFRLEIPKSGAAYWLSSADVDPSKRRENFVEADFSTLPDTTYRAWAYVGGCCTEGLSFSLQGTELPGADPGSDTDSPLKHALTSVVKNHAAHPGRKTPTRWGWVDLPLPKYTKPGAKSLRLLTHQQGLAVAWIVVSSVRDKAPTEQDVKDWDKDLPRGPGPAGPTLGLMAWYRADTGTLLDAGRVAQWQDQSGHARTLSQANGPARPVFVGNGLNGHPALRFEGASQTLGGDCPVSGLAAMTIFIVSSASKNLAGTELGPHAPMSWVETGPWGGVFLSPQQGIASWRFGSPQWGNLNPWPRPAPGATDRPLVTSVRKDAAKEELWVQGLLVHSFADKRSPIVHTSDTLTLGGGTDSRGNPLRYFSGDIAEILVFGRALSESERDAIERYLHGKYGL